VDPIEVQRSGMLKTHVRSAMVTAAGVLLALLLPTTAAGSVAPLPASNYLTRPACPAPAPGRASCLAVELVPRTAEARAHTHPLAMTHTGPLEASGPKGGAYGLRPVDLRAAYFPGEAPEAPASAPQTIALVDAYNDPEAEADLAVYDKEFGIEACTEANSCFEKVNQRGEPGHPPFPVTEAARAAEMGVCERQGESTQAGTEACTKVHEAEGWAVEISTDIETANAICQKHCHIVLVEADTDSYEDLEAAEETAVRLGREAEKDPACDAEACDTEVSNSWGGAEPVLDSAAFDQPGTVITAAAGDDGYLNWTDAAEAKEANEEYYEGADYPASSPHVVAVGGTHLGLSASGAWKEETVWNDDPRGGEENYGAGGGGCSTWFSAPVWQSGVPDWAKVGCGTGTAAKRAVADVAADADPYSGVAVYDSVPDFHEEEVGGKIVVVNTPLGWWPIGGTSVASPIIASMFALAGGSHGVEYPAQTLYEHLETGMLHTVTSGGNGECDDFYGESPATHTTCTGSLNPLSARFAFDCGKGALICNAGPGYNGPAGVGTPNGIGALKPLTEAERKAIEAKHAEEATKKAEAEAEAAAKLKAEEETAAKAKEGTQTEGPPEEKPAQVETGSKGNSGGSGSAGASGSGGSGGGGAGAGTGTSPHSSSILTGSSTPTGSGKASSGTDAVRLSNLRLTARASAVFARGEPTISQVAFAFTLSAPARVRVMLSRLVGVSGRLHWNTAAGGFTLTATRGHDRAHLRGRGTLPAGHYRLTLTPAHGAAQSLAFRLG
jgi:uncharacterized membrane protein YgcG